jgi:anthranilate phosphoribosyltransferase
MKYLRMQKQTVIQLKDDKITEMSIDPKSLNVNSEKFENLIGDDAKFNAKKND